MDCPSTSGEKKLVNSFVCLFLGHTHTLHSLYVEALCLGIYPYLNQVCTDVTGYVEVLLE